ncbi:hypothetical protein PMI35_01157 [Pseudomonas sp. GM78]|uniref:SLATT domain-containing protein n=1 Tax=Pseudomonas sp. GM78 TaxID=1144337 RepID=UPI00026F7427|nr:SLATT domain-containing protein [Pseudomonas sp. GM78]EJN31876.1 hypothetical protein PMI35_01157 [Pseudomonas sp. GM78]
MARQPDISTKKLSPWDQYKEKPTDIAMESIYIHVESVATMMCGWYWTSIRVKRWTSLVVRAASFLLLLVGTTLPIFSAIQVSYESRLLFAQSAVALLALAGLIQVADRIFGWSSGWVRYIVTVTAMENLLRVFELEWANYLLSKKGGLDTADVKVLFDLARGFEGEMTKLQADETTKWVVEFNSGVSLLESLIKTQREEVDKEIESIKTTLNAQSDVDKTGRELSRPGSIELTLMHVSGPCLVSVQLDKETPVDFFGTVWCRVNVSPGFHVVSIAALGEVMQTTQRVIEVSSGGIARIEVKL